MFLSRSLLMLDAMVVFEAINDLDSLMNNTARLEIRDAAFTDSMLIKDTCSQPEQLRYPEHTAI